MSSGPMASFAAGNHAPVSLAAVGSSPNANGASVNNQVLNLQPASGSQPGVLTTGTQVIAGDKQFTGSDIIIDNYLQVPSIKATGPSYALLVQSLLGGSSGGNDFYVYTLNTRTAGYLFTVANQSSPVFRVRYDGKMTAGDVEVGDITMWRNIVGTAPDSYLSLTGNRNAGSTGTDIVLLSKVARTAGNLVDVVNGLATIFAVSKDGAVSAGVVGNFGGNVLNAPASFIDATGASGHVSLMCADSGIGLYTVIQGTLNKSLTDGLYAYAGLHGDVTLASKYARTAGWLFEINNPTSGTGAATDKKFYVDYNGGIAQNHGLSLAGFGAAGWTLQMTSNGQYYYGQGESALMYAFDQHRWYFCDGGAWKEIPAKGDATAYDATDGSGTAGNQTINKLKGKGKFGAGATAVTITNSFVTTDSHVSVVLQTNDATAILKNVTVASGSFTANIVACTADTVFSFVVEK